MNLPDIESRLAGGGEPLTFDEALALAELPTEELPALIAAAHRVRLARAGPGVELESIISAKTGGCAEDCAFCSQSRHWPSPVRPEPFLDVVALIDAARRSEQLGATEFCIVLAVRGPDDKIMRQTLEAVEALHEATRLRVACSLGILTPDQAGALAAAGVHRYNHNLEAARSFFPQIVSTHSWEERHQTCRMVREAGMELCSGGIMGMGESMRQRIELAFELAELGPREVPINFLNPRPGTPLGGAGLLPALEAVRMIALFRLVMPAAVLRPAGGRELILRDLQALGMLAGANALIVGNYLTTLGRSVADDLRMLADLGMPVARLAP
ncbi:MAG TPA: biotin synthase BioB [Actinomycetota bacterium]|nr:biotin synthase BioB [Actinomycetota bacterium]